MANQMTKEMKILKMEVSQKQVQFIKTSNKILVSKLKTI
jgi:hypothetical protein